MPVPVLPSGNGQSEPALFPALSKNDIDAARVSSWYSAFRRVTFPTTILDLDELGEKDAFLDWLESDSIFLPIECTATEEGPRDSDEPTSTAPDNDVYDIQIEETSGSASTPGQRRWSVGSGSSSGSSAPDPPVYRLPRLSAAIRKAIKAHGGSGFPKLNWTSPRDAAFIIPQTRGPLCCSTPADVYLLLKSSDLIQHDLDPARAYGQDGGFTESQSSIGAEDMETDASTGGARSMKVEVVLRSFIEMNPSMEVRCFVRNNMLLGTSQRDTNYYDHLQLPETRQRICETVREFWEDELWKVYSGGKDYVFDLYLSSEYDSAYLVDINPYRSSTDPLLFSYPELLDILQTALQLPPANVPLTPNTSGPTEEAPPRLPILRLIDSRSHPSANSATPTYGSNMMPVEMVEMSQGRSMPEFAEAWNEVVARGMQD